MKKQERRREERTIRRVAKGDPFRYHQMKSEAVVRRMPEPLRRMFELRGTGS